MPLFGKPKYTLLKIAKKRKMPGGLWTKCPDCNDIIYNKALKENLKVCPKCDYHFLLGARERVELLLDKGSFQENNINLTSCDPLRFKGPKAYKQKLEEEQKNVGLKEAAITGLGALAGKKLAIGLTDSRFMMGSMGSVVGEKITRITELAVEEKLPLLIVSGSGGGARMQEGLLSLMQMAKTSAALMKHNEAGLLFISLLTNPTMAGVLASFASLGDIIIAEPRALIGFTGPRVIEQTLKTKLPEGFQRSSFSLEHGLIDMIVQRKNLKDILEKLLNYLC